MFHVFKTVLQIFKKSRNETFKLLKTIYIINFFFKCYIIKNIL